MTTKHELETLRPAGELVSFGRALAAGDAAFDWPYFLDKPWKWEREYAAWVELDRPGPDEAAWSTFEARVEELNR